MDAIVFTPHEIIYRPPGAAPPDAPHRVVPRCISPPRPAFRAVVENVCGAFLARYDAAGQRPLQSRSTWRFGRPHEMYHLDGNAYAHHTGRALFRGCRGAAAVRRLAEALGLPDAACAVHMSVFRFGLGRRVHTGHGCYLESRLQDRFRSLRVCCRLMDLNSLVKLRIRRFDRAEMPFFDGDGDAPACVDLSVAGSGAVICRISWRGVPWDEAREAQALRLCDWLGAELAACC